MTEAQSASLNWIENIETIKNSYDQFVWIPVGTERDSYYADHTHMFICSRKTASSPWCHFINGKCWFHSNNTDVYGRLYATDINQNIDKTLTAQVYNSTLREPDIITENTTYMNQIATILNSGTGYYDTTANFKTTLKNEYKAMQKSVNKYKGFWVGRYETSGITTSTSATLKVRAKKDTSLGTSCNWYYAYAQQKKYVYGTGTPSDTPNGITYGTGENVKRCIGGMITGSAYDRMMLFIGDYAVEGNYVKHGGSTPYSSGGDHGGCSYSINVRTESDLQDIIVYNDIFNNIYDLEGLRREMTTEAYSTDYRVLRGGSYSKDRTASYRDSVDPTSLGISGDIGSRMVLFIPAE